MNDSHTVCA